MPITHNGFTSKARPAFDGATYDSAHDGSRLSACLARVHALLSDGKWRTLAEIRAVAGGSEAGVSARLRDLRKPKFGGRQIDRRRRGNPDSGLWEYRMAPLKLKRWRR